MKKVLILGGGFAGVEAAIYLRKNDFEVTMITNRDYLYVYPTSIWVPTGESKFEDVCLPLSKIQEVHDFEVIIDEVESIKSSENRVYGKNSTYEYEHLIVAIGSGKMKHKGIENTLTICGDPKESIKMKEKIDELIAKGSGKIAMGFAGNPKDPSSVRGGPAFEVLFNVHNLLKKKGVRDNFELTFFAPMAEPGKKMGAKALKMMDMFYEKLNIKSQTGKKIIEFKEDGIAFEDDIYIESDFTMFIAAGDGLEVFKNSDLPLSEAGFIKINDYCEVEGVENVYAIGDSASLEGPDWRAKQGHIAEVMARNTAYNLVEKFYGNELRKGYKDHLNILCVMDTGDGAAFVYRSEKKGVMIPMPVVGHWMKKGWGWYYKNSKLNKIPRIPGM
jgi:sulfide:quinone oxidoreductase